MTAIVVVPLLMWAVVVFSRLVRLRNQVRTAWADIDVQRMRRHDPVPRIASAVQFYAGHERAMLDAVPGLRTQVMRIPDAPTRPDLEHAPGAGVQRLVALQACPAPVASDDFVQLHSEFLDIEARLQYPRCFCNGVVPDLDDAVQRRPDTIVARLRGIGHAALFELDGSGRRALAVRWTH